MDHEEDENNTSPKYRYEALQHIEGSGAAVGPLSAINEKGLEVIAELLWGKEVKDIKGFSAMNVENENENLGSINN